MHGMKQLGTLVLFVVASALMAPAEDNLFRYNGNGHVYFTTGSCWHGYAIVGGGGGGEAFLWRGLALGGDVGYHQFVRDIGFGMATANVTYHFVNRNRPGKLDPFLGVSPVGVYFTRGGVGGAGGVAGLGGGLNYWFTEKIGLRSEARFQVLGVGEAVVLFRIGVSFR